MAAVASVWRALMERIRNGAAPPAALRTPRFYVGGELPEAAPYGYFLFGSPGEDPGLYYNVASEEGRYIIHAWGATAWDAVELYEWFFGLTHEQPLVLSNGRVCESVQVRLLGIHGDDPALGTGQQAEIEIAVRTRAAA